MSERADFHTGPNPLGADVVRTAEEPLSFLPDAPSGVYPDRFLRVYGMKPDPSDPTTTPNEASLAFLEALQLNAVHYTEG